MSAGRGMSLEKFAAQTEAKVAEANRSLSGAEETARSRRDLPGKRKQQASSGFSSQVVLVSDVSTRRKLQDRSNEAIGESPAGQPASELYNYTGRPRSRHRSPAATGSLNRQHSSRRSDVASQLYEL